MGANKAEKIYVFKFKKSRLWTVAAKAYHFPKSSSSYENGISEDTLKILKQHINAGQQALLYLNKKGWAPVQSCLECNWSAKCKNCTVNLVLHKDKDDFMLCHFCNYKEPPPKFCKTCGSNRLKLLGIGTEQLEYKISRLIPRLAL